MTRRRIHFSFDPELLERLDNFVKLQKPTYKDRTHLVEVICDDFLTKQDKKLDTRKAH